MSDRDPPPPAKAKDKAADREASLAKALRDNLRRRKSAATAKPAAPDER